MLLLIFNRNINGDDDNDCSIQYDSIKIFECFVDDDLKSARIRILINFLFICGRLFPISLLIKSFDFSPMFVPTEITVKHFNSNLNVRFPNEHNVKVIIFNGLESLWKVTVYGN